MSRVAETKFNNLTIDGYIGGNYICTGNMLTGTVMGISKAYVTINPYNNVTNIN